MYFRFVWKLGTPKSSGSNCSTAPPVEASRVVPRTRYFDHLRCRYWLWGTETWGNQGGKKYYKHIYIYCEIIASSTCLASITRSSPSGSPTSRHHLLQPGERLRERGGMGPALAIWCCCADAGVKEEKNLEPQGGVEAGGAGGLCGDEAATSTSLILVAEPASRNGIQHHSWDRTGFKSAGTTCTHFWSCSGQRGHLGKQGWTALGHLAVWKGVGIGHKADPWMQRNSLPEAAALSKGATHIQSPSERSLNWLVGLGEPYP